MRSYNVHYSLIDLIRLHRIGELTSVDEQYLTRITHRIGINPDTIEI